MHQTIFKKRSRHFLVWLSLIAMVSTIAIFASPEVASAHSLAPATAPAPCQHILNANYSESCVLPTIPTSPCGPGQYHGATDAYNIPVNTTLTDQNNTCVTVNYNFGHSFSSCDIYFYIPAGNIATAVFNYTWHDAAGYHTGTIDENNSIAGWKTLFSSASANSLSFTDHDTPGNRNLSWGSGATYSLEVFCS